MQVIKCPNCGSGEVQHLKEDKYYCLSCDNTFMLHDSSKEFRKTDEHITDVHKDLKETISSLSSTITEGSGGEQKGVLIHGMQALKRDNFFEAYDAFDKYCYYVPNSYEGHYGKFCALTENFKCNYTANRQHMYDGFDALAKALECEDCDKEKVLSNAKAYYVRIHKKILSDTFPYEDLFTESLEKQVKVLEEEITEEQDLLNTFNSMNFFDKVKANKIKLSAIFIGVIVMLLIGTKIYHSSSGFLGVLCMMTGVIVNCVSIIWGIKLFCKVLKKPVTNIDYNMELLNGLKELISVQHMELAEMENLIKSEQGNGFGIEKMYRALCEKEEKEKVARKQAQEPLRTVVLAQRGNRKALIRVLIEVGITKQYAFEVADAVVPMVLYYNCPHSRAVEIQRRIANESGSIVNIC